MAAPLAWLWVVDSSSGSRHEDVYFSRFDQPTSTWSADYPVYVEPSFTWVPNTINRIRWPKVADGRNPYVHLIFSYDPSVNSQDNGEVIRYFRSNANGLGGWVGMPDIDTTVDWARENSLTANENNGWVYVGWHDWANAFDIFLRRGYNDGANFYAEEAFATGAGQQRWPSVAVDTNGYLHIAYLDSVSGNDQLMLRSSTAADQTSIVWQAVRTLTRPIAGVWGQRYLPDVALYPANSVSIVWYDTWGYSGGISAGAEVYWVRAL